MIKNKLILLSLLLFGINSYCQFLQEGFESPLTGWSQFQVTGSVPYNRTTTQANTGTYSEYTYTPNATGFFGSTSNHVWLISSSLDLSSATEIQLSYFEKNTDHSGSIPTDPTQQVLYSTNYSGSGNPNSATWTVINSENATNNWAKKTILGQIPSNSSVYIAFRYSGSSFNFFVPFTSQEWYLDDIEILGFPCPYTTIWNASSWSNGTPNANTSAIINSNYNTTANGSFETCNCTINNNKKVNIRPNTYITVHNNLTVNGTLHVRNKGSFVMTNDNAQISVTGTFKVHKTSAKLNDSDDYTYWSSPIKNINISSIFASGTYQQSRLYYWDQSAVNIIPGGGNQTFGEWIPAANLNMESGRGYISQSPELPASSYPLKAKVKFTGTPNNGEIILIGNESTGYPYPENAAVFNDNNNPNDDLNLIGNPYPSAIDADIFITDPTNSTSINGTLWFWTHATPNNQNTTGEQYTSNDYASYNLSGGTGAVSGGITPNQYIASGQGFVVQTNSTVQTIKFNNSMRINDHNNQFFKKNIKKSANQEKDRIWLNIESSNGGAFNQILVGFFENASDGFDKAYDGMKISTGWVNFYSRIDTLNYGIQGLGGFNSDKKVSLGFETYIEDTSVSYHISIDNIEGKLINSNVYLVDNELNIVHDLKQENYNFSVSSAGNYPDRFTLQFNKTTLGIDKAIINNDFIIINKENTLLVKAKAIMNQVKVYDITGRLLIDEKPYNNEIKLKTNPIKKGAILIINVVFDNNNSLSKKTILTE